MQNTDALVVVLMEWFGLVRKHMMGNYFSYAKNAGLTMGQFGAMLHINHKGACGVSDIGSDLGVTNSAASQMLDRLVQLKLITRTEDPTDRRGKQIVLTDQGRQVLLESNRGSQDWLVELAQSLDPVEHEQVLNSLSILIERTRALDGIPERTVT
jgi:DNA-binding MarR family transcriptional regulator